jgi:hypothetical protein
MRVLQLCERLHFSPVCLQRYRPPNSLRF